MAVSAVANATRLVAVAVPGLEESVGKIKNRENWGYKNHSTRLKNSLEGECGPKVFRKRRRTLFSDRLFRVLTHQSVPGGRRFAPTSGYFLTTLRVAGTHASSL